MVDPLFEAWKPLPGFLVHLESPLDGHLNAGDGSGGDCDSEERPDGTVRQIVEPTWNEALDPAAGAAAAGRFTVSLGGQAEPAVRSARVDTSDPKLLALTLGRGIRSDATNVTVKEARRHGIASVPRSHPAYRYMRDGDGDGVVCE